jgi:hypothetical protein
MPDLYARENWCGMQGVAENDDSGIDIREHPVVWTGRHETGRLMTWTSSSSTYIQYLSMSFFLYLLVSSDLLCRMFSCTWSLGTALLQRCILSQQLVLRQHALAQLGTTAVSSSCCKVRLPCIRPQPYADWCSAFAN